MTYHLIMYSMYIQEGCSLTLSHLHSFWIGSQRLGPTKAIHCEARLADSLSAGTIAESGMLILPVRKDCLLRMCPTLLPFLWGELIMAQPTVTCHMRNSITSLPYTGGGLFWLTTHWAVVMLPSASGWENTMRLSQTFKTHVVTFKTRNGP